jgi:hypothetical protein
MSETVKSTIAEADLDEVVQQYFRHRQKNLKPSDIEGLIKKFDSPEERDQAIVARRA